MLSGKQRQWLLFYPICLQDQGLSSKLQEGCIFYVLLTLSECTAFSAAFVVHLLPHMSNTHTIVTKILFIFAMLATNFASEMQPPPPGWQLAEVIILRDRTPQGVVCPTGWQNSTNLGREQNPTARLFFPLDIFPGESTMCADSLANIHFFSFLKKRNTF